MPSKQLLAVELKHHAGARTTDENMLEFLRHCRTRQPSRQTLETFFKRRLLPKKLDAATKASKKIELERGQVMTFLSVTNKGAAGINHSRLKLDYPNAARIIEQDGGLPADPSNGGNNVMLAPGMRLRLTRNLDKDRGFGQRQRRHRGTCALQGHLHLAHAP
eukprot:6397952-Amphidinium_carterae.1